MFYLVNASFLHGQQQGLEYTKVGIEEVLFPPKKRRLYVKLTQALSLSMSPTLPTSRLSHPSIL